jgi:hypothetical protein
MESGIDCEVCSQRFGPDEWRKNQGYCPQCDQPIGRLAREMLELPRTDFPESEEVDGPRTATESD